MPEKRILFPELPIAAWEPTKKTFHRYLQIVGKIRLALMPRKNHWWYITLYIDSQGMSTDSIPYGDFVFSIRFDLIEHRLHVNTSLGENQSFELKNGLSVADFHSKLMAILADLDCRSCPLRTRWAISEAKYAKR